MRLFTFCLALGFLFTLQKGLAQCSIDNMTVEVLPCNEADKFAVKINFTHANTSDQGFKIQGNGTVYGTYQYADLPIIIDGLSGNCVTPYEFVAKDILFPTCTDNVNLGTVCCNANTDCSINIIDAVALECIDNSFTLKFNLEHNGGSNAFYELWSGQEYVGFYKYSELPAIINNFPSNGEDFEQIIVCENDNNGCCDTLYLESPCACNIYGVQTRKLECSPEDSTYYLKINFKHNQTSDSFQLGGNAGFFGTYAYNELPIVVGPIDFNADSISFLLVDQDNILCFEEFIIPPYQECNTECDISNVEVEYSACEGNKFYAFIRFDSNNPGVKGFKIRGNGMIYGTYLYGEDFYKVGPLEADCEKKYEFVIVDEELQNCTAEYNMLEPICCDSICEIGEIVAQGFCDGLVKKVKLSFNHNQNPTSQFNLKIKGVFIGTYTFGSLPITFPYDFVDGQQYGFYIYNDNCAKEVGITLKCTNQEGCIIKEVSAQGQCEGDIKKVKLTFIHNQDPSTQFNLKINGVLIGTYTFGSLPITFPYTFVEGQSYGFFIYNDACAKEANLILKCNNQNECSIYDLVAEAHSCDENGKFLLDVDFEHNSGVSQKFKIFVNDHVFGPFEYGQPFYTVGPLPGDCSINRVKVIDLEKNGCFDVFEFNEAICCGTCNLKVGDIIPVCQNGKITALKIGVSNPGSGTDSVKIRIGGINYGNKAYSDSPFLINIPDQAPGTYVLNLRLADTQLGECVIEVQKELTCGGEQECQLAELHVSFVDCTESKFVFDINFVNQNTPSDSFYLWIKNDLYGPYAYGDQPIQTPEYNKNEAPYRVRIEDSEKEGCALQKNFELIDCSLPTVDNVADNIILEYQNNKMVITSTAYHGPSNLELFDAVGRKIYSQTIELAAGVSSYNIDSQLQGISIVRLTNKQWNKTQTIVRI